MVPKKNISKKGKGIEVPIEYNRAKFVNTIAKLKFDKALEIKKKLYSMKGFGILNKT